MGDVVADSPDGVRQQNIPDEPRRRVYYQPTGHGHAVREPSEEIYKIIREMTP